MAKYRWGFEELDTSFTPPRPMFIECEPRVEDDSNLQYAQQSNEIFYRAKLNGNLAFRFEFDYILAKGYNYTHIVVLQTWDDDNSEWTEIWRGRFVLTDCEIDYESNTITVTPETLDRYTAILDNLDKEYNLTKLAIGRQPVNFLIRPCLQIYSLNNGKITNCIGNNIWEASCDIKGKDEIGNFHFNFDKENFAVGLQWTSNFPVPSALTGLKMVYSGTPNYEGNRDFDIYGRYQTGWTPELEPIYATHKLQVHITQYPDETVFSVHIYDEYDVPQDTICYVSFLRDEAGTPGDMHIADEGTPQAYLADATAQWDKVYSRILVQTELDSIEIHGTTYTLNAIPSDDLTGANLNYNKILTADFIDVVISGTEQSEPTEWGLNYNDKYFVKPSDTATIHYAPAGQDLWKYVSLWWNIDSRSSMEIVNDELTADRTIRDGYRLDSTVMRLLQKAGWTGQYWISRAFNGNNDYIGDPFIPIITPKSNVISSYYDTPAQNAPISLAKIFSMLKNAYKCYWYIDENNNIHFEHISYYENGYSYTETEPQILVDLDIERHTRTLNTKAFGQNIVKFDKQEMPQQFTFGWGDKQTIPFDGYAINCLDAYVQKGQTSDQISADFDTDVDFVLSSPNDVSREGFFLFACPVVNGTIDYSMRVESVRITDESGDTYNVELQNADAAFVKIHQSWWRYKMPCENLQVNNENTNAITTGEYKQQSVEFADLSMAEILANPDNCNKIIRTQQGNGHIKNITITLNSMAAKGDLLFNFIGRKYYLRGTALSGTITININGESKTIIVDNNTFILAYTEPIAELDFAGSDVVSVNFRDCDSMAELTSADDMFKNCAELVAVDFGNKTFGAVTSANDMFAGCAQLSQLIVPATESWKPDLDFTDCPNLTAQSLNDLIVRFLYSYESGVHTITPNSTMWNGLSADVQTDLITKATAKGWQIGIPAQYSLSGTSTGSTVYATINGAPVEIEVVGGAWHYDYHIPITAISFLNDSNLTTIDFTSSDLLSGVTSLNDAFKGCSALTSVDFTGCDLSNVATAADCFSGCVALTSIVADSGVWKPDVDLSDTAMVYADMLSTIGMLYTYATGTHTISFNSTIWDSLTQPQQQTISDAADAKGWTTNAVMVIYVIRGTSTNVNGTETFNIQFINDGALSPSAAEQITCAVDANGKWEYEYSGKKIYSLDNFCRTDGNLTNNTITSISFANADDLLQCVSIRCLAARTNADITFTQTLENIITAGDDVNGGAFMQAHGRVEMNNATFASLTNAGKMFRSYTKNINLPAATFESLTKTNSADNLGIFSASTAQSISLPSATFENVTTAIRMFYNCTSLTSVSMPSATFERLVDASGMFEGCTVLPSVDLSHTNLQALEIVGDRVKNYYMFSGCTSLQSVDFGTNTFPSLKQAVAWFSGCSSLTSVTWGAPLFDKLLTFDFAFANCTSIVNAPNLSAATFENVQDLRGTFRATKIVTLNMPSATFASVTNAVAGTNYADNHGAFYDCKQLTTINMPSATFASILNKRNMFYNNIALTTINVPSSSTMPSTSASLTERHTDLRYSPLTYASMLNVANWLTDFTGYTAPTCTFKASAWNALSSAEQATIDGILSGKNWNRAIA